jgi:hypothetical protein
MFGFELPNDVKLFLVITVPIVFVVAVVWFLTYLTTRRWGSLTKSRTPCVAARCDQVGDGGVEEDKPVPLRLYMFEGRHALQLFILADMALDDSSRYEGRYRLWEYVARYVPGSDTYAVKGTTRNDGWSISFKAAPTAVVVVNDTTVSLQSTTDLNTLIARSDTELIRITDDTPRLADSLKPLQSTESTCKPLQPTESA